MNGREVQSVNEILQALHIDDEVRNDTLVALAPFMSKLQNLERTMDESGVDQKIIASCQAAIDVQVKLLKEVYGSAT